MLRFVVTLIVALAVAAPAWAQTGSVSGTVVDQSGAAVAGATVVLDGPAGSGSATSGPDGSFAFRSLAGGAYRLTVTLADFSPVAPRDVVVGGGPVVLPPLTLTVAPLSETVVVTASKSEGTLATAPATMSVVTSAAIATTPRSTSRICCEPSPASTRFRCRRGTST